jgi:glycerol uptake facilitator protein
MDHSFVVRLFAEFFGTALLVILGNGAVANTELQSAKGFGTGWLNIAVGYGAGVAIPALAFGAFSAQINPAFTLALAVTGHFPWAEVAPYILVQVLGAMVGQLVVVLVYTPYFRRTTNDEAFFAPFATTNAADNKWNGFWNEFFGTFILVIGALGITEAAAYKGIAGLGLGVLVATLVTSMGGATGPGLNPARDFGPRLVHQFLTFKHKGSSHWDYAAIPVVAPILGAIVAAMIWYGAFA